MVTKDTIDKLKQANAVTAVASTSDGGARAEDGNASSVAADTPIATGDKAKDSS